MKLNFHTSRTSNIFTENRLLKFVMVAMATGFVFNSFLVYRAIKHQSVIVIPAKLTKQIEFVNGQPNPSYVKDLLRDVLSLALTYTPAIARRQFSELLAYYAPEAYPEGSKAWYALAGNIEDAKTSSVFFIQSIDVKDKRAEVFGTLKQFAGDTPFLGETRTYVVDYRFLDGRFQILSFKQKSAGSGKKL